MFILAKPGNVHIRVIQKTRFDYVHVSETRNVHIRVIQNARFDDVHISETRKCAYPSFSEH